MQSKNSIRPFSNDNPSQGLFLFKGCGRSQAGTSRDKDWEVDWVLKGVRWTFHHNYLMNIKILTLLFVTFALHTYADTIAWRGVSDLGGNGLSIVTGSQTRGADGSFSTSSSSSSSSFNDGYGVSSSPPRTTWTIASSRPIDTLVTTTPTSRSTTPVTTTQIPSLTGSWYITTVGNQSVNIPSSFSSSSINFDYCNPQRFSYSTSGSSFISISGGNTGTQSCSYSGPT